MIFPTQMREGTLQENTEAKKNCKERKREKKNHTTKTIFNNMQKSLFVWRYAQNRFSETNYG